MVIVDFDIAGCRNVQIEQAVGGNLVEHVIEERHPSLGVTTASPIEIDLDSDISFSSLAMDFGNAV